MTGRGLMNFPELFATIKVYCLRYMLPGNHLSDCSVVNFLKKIHSLNLVKRFYI